MTKGSNGHWIIDTNIRKMDCPDDIFNSLITYQYLINKKFIKKMIPIFNKMILKSIDIPVF